MSCRGVGVTGHPGSSWAESLFLPRRPSEQRRGAREGSVGRAPSDTSCSAHIPGQGLVRVCPQLGGRSETRLGGEVCGPGCTARSRTAGAAEEGGRNTGLREACVRGRPGPARPRRAERRRGSGLQRPRRPAGHRGHRQAKPSPLKHRPANSAPTWFRRSSWRRWLRAPVTPARLCRPPASLLPTEG